jgi:hypothetical protein
MREGKRAKGQNGDTTTEKNGKRDGKAQQQGSPRWPAEKGG